MHVFFSITAIQHTFFVLKTFVIILLPYRNNSENFVWVTNCIDMTGC